MLNLSNHILNFYSNNIHFSNLNKYKIERYFYLLKIFRNSKIILKVGRIA